MHNVAAREFWKVAAKCAASVLQISKNDTTGCVIAPRLREVALTGGIVGLVCAVPFMAAVAAGPYIVTQKGQMFHPGELSINRGDTVEIVNDDGELIHHAYVDSKTFSFDSGDQEPGSKTDIVFSVPGTFVVLCGIHPKMRLDVTVK
jgi:plastocyanin